MYPAPGDTEITQDLLWLLIFLQKLASALALLCSTCVLFSFFSNALVLAGHKPGADVGPLISPQAKQRVEELVESGVKEGARVSYICKPHSTWSSKLTRV